MTDEINEFTTCRRLSSPTYSMYKLLKDLCVNNAEHFRVDESEAGQRLYCGFLALADHLDMVTAEVDVIRKIAPEFDFDENTPGNGYRSFVSVVDTCVINCVKMCRGICVNRDSFIFRKSHSVREVESWGQVLASLGTCLQHLKTLLSWSSGNSLFPLEHHTPEELLLKADNINRYCFYGRCLGFQYCDSIRKVVKFISVAMASFSEVYYKTGGLISRATTSLITGGKFLWDPELRARRIISICQSADVDFCKSFWLLQEAEIMQQLPSFVCPTLAVNRVISIPPEPLKMPTSSGTSVNIPIPSSHKGPEAVNVRLLSPVQREGVGGECDEKGSQVLQPSDGIIIHCHGGGFVAQSSKSHEVYLRDWAWQLDVPILSIDYSLSPEAPFPRPLEEAFYVYCWALQNCHILGSTAKRVVFVGDSAGANILTVVAMQCIEFGIRHPDGLFLAYCPTMIQFIPSPSRMLLILDPLLPIDFMLKCLKAYAGHTAKVKEGHNEDREAESRTQETSVSSPSELDSSLSEYTPPNDSVQKTATADKASLQARTDPEHRAVSKSSTDADRHRLTGSDTESFEEVSETELVELVHKSPSKSDGGSDTLTTVSLTSEMSKPEADQYLNDHAKKKPGTEDDSKQYVSEFLERYVLDSDTDSEGQRVPVLRTESIGSESDEQVLFEIPRDLTFGFSDKLSQAASRVVTDISSRWASFTRQSSSPESEQVATKAEKRGFPLLGKAEMSNNSTRNLIKEFQNFKVAEDPYLSPALASDDLLRQLPPVSLLSLHMDPCLDECVTFAKQLRDLGNKVHLDVLDGLPHGFLNFSLHNFS